MISLSLLLSLSLSVASVARGGRRRRWRRVAWTRRWSWLQVSSSQRAAGVFWVPWNSLLRVAATTSSWEFHGERGQAWIMGSSSSTCVRLAGRWRRTQHRVRNKHNNKRKRRLQMSRRPKHEKFLWRFLWITTCICWSLRHRAAASLTAKIWWASITRWASFEEWRSQLTWYKESYSRSSSSCSACKWSRASSSSSSLHLNCMNPCVSRILIRWLLLQQASASDCFWFHSYHISSFVSSCCWRWWCSLGFWLACSCSSHSRFEVSVICMMGKKLCVWAWRKLSTLMILSSLHTEIMASSLAEAELFL